MRPEAVNEHDPTGFAAGVFERQRISVLLIEDNELDARMMTKNLTRVAHSSFRIERVADLNTAVERLGNSTYDCVLLDLSLPDSEGLLALDVLAEEQVDLPIVVLTGLDDPTTAFHAVQRGAQDYLTKGDATAAMIGRSIRYAMARYQSESQLRTTTELLDVLRDRERIARDLHDTVIQQLFATGIRLQAVSGQADDAAVRDAILTAVDAIDDANRQLREAIFGLHDVDPETVLAQEIVDIIDSERAALGFTPVFRIGSVESVPESLRRDVIAVIREALSNVAKHAGATATEVVVDASDGELVLTITDNGTGMRQATSNAGGSGAGRGLRNLAARAAEQGGTFRIGPGPGGGTELMWAVSYS